VPVFWKWTAITLMAVVGLIHLLEAPEYFQLAAYLGVLFLANALGATVATGGIMRERKWGWLLGVLVAGGAIIAYFVSRAVGLPGFANAPWFESIDVVALLVEVAFVAIAVKVLSKRPVVHMPGNNRLPTAT
jgi:Kef-type K+ transport system membrane component KefB